MHNMIYLIAFFSNLLILKYFREGASIKTQYLEHAEKQKGKAIFSRLYCALPHNTKLTLGDHCRKHITLNCKRKLQSKNK